MLHALMMTSRLTAAAVVRPALILRPAVVLRPAVIPLSRRSLCTLPVHQAALRFGFPFSHFTKKIVWGWVLLNRRRGLESELKERRKIIERLLRGKWAVGLDKTKSTACCENYSNLLAKSEGCLQFCRLDPGEWEGEIHFTNRKG